jgi:WD40 repeat protein/DNA-binding SARP family transcriptional activator
MLQIRLLGQFDIRLDGKRIVIASRAGQSLLAYLALTAGTPHRREKLAGTLWPDSSEENARKNLRQELWRIRKAIPAQNLPEADDYLIADEYTLTFNRDADYWLDVSILEKSDPDIQSLTSSLSLYQGELLPGFYDDWVVLERERLQTLFESKMEQLVEKLVESERWTAVQEQCERWLSLGFVSESAYRALMLSYNARGDMAKVSTIYQRCVEDLQDHFGVEPSAETHALFNGLLKGAKVPRRILPAQLSGTITFLFTDIQGSTRLLDKLGDQYATSLAEHHHILRTAIQKWKGTEMDTQGDAFFVTFARALDAVQCAMEAQRELAEHTWLQDEPIRVRMGLHTGEPLIASTGYVGMDVHRAARIGDAGHGGQVLLSQTTRDLVMQDLPPGITIKDLGEYRLKDMKYPTPIYQLVIEDLQTDFPPLKTKFTGSEAPVPGEPPFKGLQYFDEEDSDLFFGRELLTAKLVRRLRELPSPAGDREALRKEGSGVRFLSVVIGASGSGKSSLVRAGLIPALKKGSTLLDGTKPPQGSTDWQVHILTPTAHPLEALATELMRDSDSVATTARLIDDLAQEPRSLALFLARKNSKRHIVLVVDQFEELFTLCRDEFEREAFIDNLLNLVSSAQSNTTLIMTLRADFYAHLAQYPELRDAVAQQQEYIGPMTAEELRLAIEQPARRGHWEFEPGLVDLILRDVGDEPGALPLLSHALLETWKRRAGHTLTLKGYADAGGVHGAIAHTAESIYQNLSPEEQAIARDIFLRLTELGEGTEDTRRRVSFEELTSSSENSDHVRAVLNKLAEARLITLGENTVEVAHEALIREWPTLGEWLNQDREGLRLHRHLTEAAYEWELLGRDPGALYRGAHLAQARAWAKLHPNSLNTSERVFLNVFIEQEQHEELEREEGRQRELAAAKELAETQRQSASRLRTRNRVITTVGSIAVILALLAGMFGVQSNQQRARALKAQSESEANFRQAEAQRLAAEANSLFLSGGSPELIALLSLRSINTQYSAQGDAILTSAAGLDFPLRVFTLSNDDLTDIAYSPDGKYLIIGSNDKIAHLLDIQTGQEIKKFSGHTDVIYSVAFSPDGKSILTGSFDNTTRLWNVATGQELRKFDGLGFEFSPDGKSVLTINIDNADNRVRLWDVRTGKELRQFIGHTELVQIAIFSPDGKYVLTGSFDKTARLWDAATGKELMQLPVTTQMEGVSFSPDGKTIATSGEDSIVRLWDPTTGQKLKEISGHTGPVAIAVFSPDGKYLLTNSDDGTSRLWDVKTAQEVRRLNPAGQVFDVNFSPDGKTIAIDSENRVMLWSITPHPSLAKLEHKTSISGVAFSPSGKLALTGGLDGIARLWDLSTGQELRQFIGHTTVINFGVSFSPDGKEVLTGSWDNTVRLWDASTGQQLRVFTTLGPVNSVNFSPDGKLILAGSNDKTAWLWDAATGQKIMRFGPTDVVLRAVFSADGKLIATAGADGGHVWDRTTGQELQKLDNDGNGMFSIAFSPDGKYLLSSDTDNTVRLWDGATREELRQFPHAAWTAAFSPGGRYIATAGFDGTTRLWDVQNGQELRRLIAHKAGVEDVDFSPDGKYLLTGSDDGTAMLWDVDYQTTMEYLCSVLLRDFTEDERAQYGIKDQTPTCPKS